MLPPLCKRGYALPQRTTKQDQLPATTVPFFVVVASTQYNGVAFIIIWQSNTVVGDSKTINNNFDKIQTN
jgi:hypothetical protein